MRLKSCVWRPVSKIDDGARDTQWNAVILHTAVSGQPSLYDWWQSGSAGAGVGAHIYVNKDGHAEQYIDSDRYTGHAWDANHWTVAIETWDNVDPAHTPWTDAQLDKIVEILQELQIPAQEIACPGPGNGVGWHEKCPTWNQSHHTCPGSLRENQIRTVIIPRLQGGITLSELQDYFGLKPAEAQGNAQVEQGIRKYLGDWKAGTDGKNRPGSAGHEQDGYDFAAASLSGKAPPA